mgnify:CR=1 FL=1
MIRFSILKRFLSLSFVLAMLIPAMGHAEFLAKGDPKPAVIIFSQSNDGGWSQAIHEARMRLEGSMDIRIPQAEGIPETVTTSLFCIAFTSNIVFFVLQSLICIAFICKIDF